MSETNVRVPWNATLSVEDLTRWGVDPSKAHGVSGVLCSGLFGGSRQVLLLPIEPLVDADGRFVMTVESGTVCELGTCRLWDFVVCRTS
jgi:hypothetical protein